MTPRESAITTLVNICGESYSGTTLLELMLGHGPEAFACGEVAYRYRPISQAHRTWRCPCGANPCPIWNRFREVPPHQLHAAVARQLVVTLVTDSSKRLSWVMDVNRWGAAQGLRVVNLVIWKSSLAHLYSHWKRGHSLGTAMHRYHRYYTRVLDCGLSVISVNYHRLVAHPADELAAICLRLGIEYFPGKECFWNQQSHNLFGNLGTQRQVGAADGTIEEESAYPQEFLAAAEKLNPLGKPPTELTLLQRLAACDISQNFGIQEPLSTGQLPPWWYYRQRLGDHWRAFWGLYRPAEFNRLKGARD